MFSRTARHTRLCVERVGHERLKLEAGDTVFAIETDRGILVTPYDPETGEALAVAGKIARKYRGALRELAK